MATNSLQRKILDTLRSDVVRTLNQLHEPSDIQLLKTIFKNYRRTGDTDVGLRLTYIGNRLLSKRFDSYTYTVNYSPNHAAFIALDRHMVWPYYVGSRIVVFYSKQDAAWFRINGEDLSNFAGTL